MGAKFPGCGCQHEGGGGTGHLGASLLDLAYGEVKDSAGCRQPFWAMVADPAAAVFDA